MCCVTMERLLANVLAQRGASSGRQRCLRANDTGLLRGLGSEHEGRGEARDFLATYLWDVILNSAVGLKQGRSAVWRARQLS